MTAELDETLKTGRRLVTALVGVRPVKLEVTVDTGWRPAPNMRGLQEADGEERNSFDPVFWQFFKVNCKRKAIIGAI